MIGSEQSQNSTLVIYQTSFLYTNINNPLNQPLLSKTETWGDTTFSNMSAYSNMEIILNGNLTVASGGNLTLTNVTLRVNCAHNGEHRIEVQNGGALYINDTDRNPNTREDASNITAYNPSYRFLFWVKSGATFHMNNSELHYCGYSYYNYIWDHEGLWINTNNTVIENNTLTYNYYGIILYEAHHNIIKNNNVTNNKGSGFYFQYSTHNNIIGNTAKNNRWSGFHLSIDSNYNNLTNNVATRNWDGFSLGFAGYNNFTGNIATHNRGNCGFSIDYSSHNNFTGNIATNNLDGFSLMYSEYNTLTSNNSTKNYNGFSMWYSDNNILSDNNATNNWDEGFELWYSEHNTITGNTIIYFIGRAFSLLFSYNNIIENNTVIFTGRPLLYTLLFINNQQYTPAVSIALEFALLLTVVPIVLVIIIIRVVRKSD